MQILGLLGMYFDALVIFITSDSLLFKLTLVLLWTGPNILTASLGQYS